jgi:hypothetical protein
VIQRGVIQRGVPGLVIARHPGTCQPGTTAAIPDLKDRACATQRTGPAPPKGPGLRHPKDRACATQIRGHRMGRSSRPGDPQGAAALAPPWSWPAGSTRAARRVRRGHLLASFESANTSVDVPGCGARHDRDVKAAKNILAAGRAVAQGRGLCGSRQSARGNPPADSSQRGTLWREPQNPSFRAGGSQFRSAAAV